MLKSTLKSTTSLVLGVGLLAAPAFAQEVLESGDNTGLELCVGLAPTAEGSLPETLPDAEGLTAALPCLDTEGNVITDATVLLELLATEAVEGDEVETVDSGAVDGADPVGGDAATAVETDEIDTELDETETEAQEDLDLEIEEAEVEAEVEADAEAEAEVEAQAAPAEDAPTEEELEAQLEAAEAEAEAEAEAAAEAEETVVVEDEAIATEDDAEEPVTVSEGLPEGDEDVTAGDATVTTEDEVTEGEPEVIVVEEEEAPAAAAAAAASDDDMTQTETAEGAVDVEVEELAEEDVRTSDQDFATAASEQAATSSDGDEGLSPFQRALLLGLGAVVVGEVLNNGDQVVSNSGDRVVVERDGELVVLKDDDVLLRQPGAQVQTQSFEDGSTRTIVTRADGDRIVTIRSNDGRVLRRARVLPDGTQIVLFDDTQPPVQQESITLPTQTATKAPSQVSDSDIAALREALAAVETEEVEQNFTLRQIRQIRQVRELAPEVELDTITFASGSAAIAPSQARELANLGSVIADLIEDDPSQVFLIEGHTDAVGDAGYNLALSDRRAETVALAMTEYFGVPPENLITQGYGEAHLKIQTQGDERANRRASVRNITPLLR